MIMRMHTIDPRTKLILVITFSTSAVLVNGLIWLVALLLLVILTSLCMGGKLKPLIVKLKKLYILLIGIIIIQSIFTRGGNPVLQVGNLNLITDIGIWRGVNYLLRITIVILSVSILMTSSERRLLQGLIQLGLPYELAYMVSIAIRFLPLLKEEMQDSLNAIMLRGVNPKAMSMSNKLKLYQYVLTPIILGALNKSKQLAISMESRGFRAYHQRTSLIELRFRWLDYVLCLVAVGILGLYLTIRVVGG
ncbi:energy-coupling factor transporter transmembrane component T family protein [Vallitalea okinawensis]|uniref:energy-coupling factor transporter transmembrane component T family protein n=1 Tax=Vallitalea okinawensis TaxID=2078660 RepID=UPI000CFE1685|nr:energy-coupling factor transporter transmembrane component T [Vallitalea okinawensis]